MITASTAAGEALESPAIIPAWKVEIDLPIVDYNDVSLAVESLEVDSSMVSDLPDGTRLITGYATDAATVVLSGMVDPSDETHDAAWLFGMYRTDSPLYRKRRLNCPIRVYAGVQPEGEPPELLQVFTGLIDSVQVGSNGQVTITALDNNALLRSIPDLPAVITAPPYNAGLTSEFAMDAVLRAASGGAISTWPAQRAHSVLAVGMRSSMAPEVGSLESVNVLAGGGLIPPSFAPGEFGTALSSIDNEVDALYALGSNIPATSDVFIEYWASQQAACSVMASDFNAAGAYTSVGISLAIAPGLITASIGPDFWTQTVPVDTDVHYLGAQFHWAAGSSSWSVTLHYDGTTYSSGTRTISGSRPTGDPLIAATVSIGQTTTSPPGTLEAVQISAESAGASNYGFVPQAVLDRSLNKLTVTPAIAAGSAGGALQQIAEAERGVARFDGSGIFRFTNRKTLQTLPLARTISSQVSLESLDLEETASEIANDCTVPYKEWTFGAPATVWSAAGVKSVQGRQTVTLSVTLPDGTLVASIPDSASLLPSGTPTAGQNYYLASIDAAGTAAFPAPLAITVVQKTSSRFKVSIHNPSGGTAYLVSPFDFLSLPPGTPTLQIGGIPVTAGDEQTVNYQYPPLSVGGAASSVWGDQPTTFGSSDWNQDYDTALTLAQDVVIDMSTPTPDFTNLSCVPDPRLVVTDRVMILDPDRSGAAEFATIFGRTLKYAAGGNSMTVDARAATSPGGMLFGITGRCETGDNAYIPA